jgi:hypothetical protein
MVVVSKGSRAIATSACCTAAPGNGRLTWCAGYRENAIVDGGGYSFRVVRMLNVQP